MDAEKKRFLTAVSVLVGSTVGAGGLGIPYVAAQTGFFTTLGYILLIGLIIITINLYFGEVVLRTRGKHQVAGYGNKYLGKKGKIALEFALIFGIYSAIVAYMIGVGESLSFLFFGNSNSSLLLGVLFGSGMSVLFWRGLRALKRFEKLGVSMILILLLLIVVVFFRDINVNNLYFFNPGNFFLPFGVVLFALMSFYAIPQISMILHENEKIMKKVLITGTLISMTFYILFTLIVVGVNGSNTPEIATLSLGGIFILLGVLTMFTSYLTLGNALQENFMYDERFKKKKAWIFAAILPILIFIVVKFIGLFSFVKVISLGGVVSGGLIAVLILFMVKKAKKKGNRRPEFKLPVNWLIIGFLSLIFVLGLIVEFLK
jgi:amino acid permease